MAKALGAGARPFEVVVGAPVSRYGARITFAPARGGGHALAAAFGLAEHPLGVSTFGAPGRLTAPCAPNPTWIGVRARSGEPLRVKAYHALRSHIDLDGLPDGLCPVMMARDGEDEEIYLRLGPACAWGAFAAACAARIGAQAPRVRPRPRPAPDGFGVSLRRRAGRIVAVSLFAHHRALPDERAVREAWALGLDAIDARAHEIALAAVRSLGALPGGAWHAALAWTIEEGGAVHRAASLAVPR